MTKPGLFINSGCLFGIAKQAYERAKAAAKHDRSFEQREPLIAIVFAAAAAEGFINEMRELALQCCGVPPWAGVGPEPDQVENLGSLLSEVEGAGGTTKLKFLVGKLALSGRPFDKGANPYQDFAMLLDLRNSLVHLKFDRIEYPQINEVRVQHPDVINKLRSKNILAEFEDEQSLPSWVVLVSTPAVARWACNAIAAIVKDLVGSIPDSELRRKAELFYYQFGAFAPVT